VQGEELEPRRREEGAERVTLEGGGE